ncbi:GntR family transcriptional regulator [Paraburkholderia mimosarum]|uniref:GntR family transcriptional regulator n=1 Tax=Paraburkholderia mimosarum TaxID=312026 RepID=UPI0009DECBDE|nr:GntR family transcriptional regulator [Paraburkholderia mimosarum]
MRTTQSTSSVSPPTPRATPTTTWLPDFARIRGKVPLAIADQIEQAIQAGLLRPGDTLPAQRTVADVLGFHLNTINAGFREAARRGLILSRTRRGSVVSALARSV